MKKTLIFVTIASFFLYSCNNTTDSKEPESNAASDAVMQPSEPTVSDAPVQVPAADTGGITTMPVSTTIAPPQPAASTAAGMNPAHGAPGHRCDIAVGAPLSSAPAANPASGTQVTAQPPSSPVITSSPTINSQPVVKTAPGMNPPHGEPGHDCAIAVGAPLKK